jgi:hypothetical protein
MQTTEVVGGVSGLHRCVLEAYERLILGRDHGLEVGEDLVAEFGGINVSAESRQFVAAHAPTPHEVFPVHLAHRVTGLARKQNAPQKTLLESADLP